MTTFIIRNKIIKNNYFKYFASKNIVIFSEENNFEVDEYNTFLYKNNLQIIIKIKKNEIILPINFSFFPVYCYFKKARFT